MGAVGIWEVVGDSVLLFVNKAEELDLRRAWFESCCLLRCKFNG